MEDTGKYKKIIRISRFKPNPTGDGAAKRSYQIVELLKANGFEVYDETLELPKRLSLLSQLRLFLIGMLFALRHLKYNQICHLGGLVNESKYFGLRIAALKKYEDQRDKVLFLIEDTTQGAHGLPYILEDMKCRFVMVPHNIESLCVGVPVLSGERGNDWFKDDMERLRKAEEAFCISKEETWLTQLYGVKSHYLPYYPIGEIEKYLLAIRKKRENKEVQTDRKKQILLLGSASNAPTRNGMQNIIMHLARYAELPFELHVAGYRTEWLKQVEHPGIVYHGTLTQEQLESMMVSTDALLVYQEATSGALTRIIEYLVAGIPVVASFCAARDYYRMSGLYVYEQMDELMTLLQSIDIADVPMPQRMNINEVQFINRLKQI